MSTARIALGSAVAAIVLALILAALMRPCARPFPPDPVLVPLGTVPPDACVAYYGPGPCYEHGMTVRGSTDAVAGPPPAGWRGKVKALEARP